MWLLLKKNHQKGQRFGDKGKQNILFHGNNFNQNKTLKQSFRNDFFSVGEVNIIITVQTTWKQLFGWLVKTCSFKFIYFDLFGCMGP